MYRLYIFNDNFFITIYNFKDEYRYTRIDKKDIIDERIKEFYLKNNEKLKIRIGKIEGTEREVIQYIGFIGGEK